MTLLCGVAGRLRPDRRASTYFIAAARRRSLYSTRAQAQRAPGRRRACSAAWSAPRVYVAAQGDLRRLRCSSCELQQAATSGPLAALIGGIAGRHARVPAAAGGVAPARRGLARPAAQPDRPRAAAAAEDGRRSARLLGALARDGEPGRGRGRRRSAPTRCSRASAPTITTSARPVRPSTSSRTSSAGERSPHEELEPDVSADAIMAHVVEGARILRDGRIPEPVVEFVVHAPRHQRDRVLLAQVPASRGIRRTSPRTSSAIPA